MLKEPSQQDSPLGEETPRELLHGPTLPVFSRKSISKRGQCILSILLIQGLF